RPPLSPLPRHAPRGSPRPPHPPLPPPHSGLVRSGGAGERGPLRLQRGAPRLERSAPHRERLTLGSGCRLGSLCGGEIGPPEREGLLGLAGLGVEGMHLVGERLEPLGGCLPAGAAGPPPRPQGPAPPGLPP